MLGLGIPMVFINKKDDAPEFIKPSKSTKNANVTEELKTMNKHIKACNSEVHTKIEEVKSLLGSYNKSKDCKIEQALEGLTSLQSKRDQSSKKFLVTANVLFAQLKDQKNGQQKMDQKMCGLCGSTKKKLTKTQCCKNWICDDEHLYQMCTYSKVSCYRNHHRYTLCSSHSNENHSGKWQNCKKCKSGSSLELYTYHATNRYNFEKLENPPKISIVCSSCHMRSGRVEDFAGSVTKPCEHGCLHVDWYCHDEDCEKKLRML